MCTAEVQTVFKAIGSSGSLCTTCVIRMTPANDRRFIWFPFYKVCFVSLTADGRQRARLPIPPTATSPVVTKDLPISPRFSPDDFFSRCKFSTLTSRQTMVEFYFSRSHAFRYDRSHNTNPVFLQEKSNSRLPH